MSGDSKNSDLAPGRSIKPKYPVSRRRFLLCISLEDFFAIRPIDAAKFVGFQTGMPGIGSEIGQGLFNVFVSSLL